MPYIGNNLATQFQAFATQTITGDGSTSYTLDRAVANGKELLVYINNVKQEEGSGKSYEASGTTITFSAAVSSGDSCYLVYMGSAQQTVTAPAGSIVSSQFSSADLVLPKTVTIGSAAEEDTKLVFDGNAQDFHIGLDDSADDLVIGKGSALGTTTHMAFTEDGEVTKPLQPSFLVYKNPNQSNMATDTTVTVTFENEVFDVGTNFASNTFTAPVTGKYLLGTTLILGQPSTAAAYVSVIIKTSNRDYTATLNDYDAFDSTAVYFSAGRTFVCDMDAGDTAFVGVYQGGGSATTDIYASTTGSIFFGHLLG